MSWDAGPCKSGSGDDPDAEDLLAGMVARRAEDTGDELAARRAHQLPDADLSCPEGHHPPASRRERRRQQHHPRMKPAPPWATGPHEK